MHNTLKDVVQANAVAKTCGTATVVWPELRPGWVAGAAGFSSPMQRFLA